MKFSEKVGNGPLNND